MAARTASAASAPGTLPRRRLRKGEHRVLSVIGLSLPIGWGEDARPSTWYGALAGWTLTTLAISLGAPFWFDILGRAARLRSTGVRLRTSEPASAEREPQEGARAEEPGAARP